MMSECSNTLGVTTSPVFFTAPVMTTGVWNTGASFTAATATSTSFSTKLKLVTPVESSFSLTLNAMILPDALLKLALSGGTHVMLSPGLIRYCKSALVRVCVPFLRTLPEAPKPVTW